MFEVLVPAPRRRSEERALAIVGILTVLYALGGCSNTPGDLKSLARGAMARLTPTTQPTPPPDTSFKDAGGGSHTLADFKGKVAVVNLWANWCAPCKEEIPSLAKLAAAYAGKPVVVAAISVGKGADEVAGRAFIGRNPPLVFYTEPTYALTSAFKPSIDGMPTTIIYDRKGVERARLAGGADWSGPDAHAVVESLMAEQ